MSNRKVRYQQWMDALVDNGDRGNNSDHESNKAVREALEKLKESERQLVERRFLMGQSFKQISADLNFSERELEKRLREVTLKLRRLLGPFVERRFNLKIDGQRHCPICECAERKKAEEIIAGKRDEDPWRRVMRELRQCVGLKIDSPQTIIGHVKYHAIDRG